MLKVCQFVTVFCLFCVDVILDASFSENFYSLRRVTHDSSSHVIPGVSADAVSSDESVAADTQFGGDRVQHLTRSDRRRSLLFLASWPVYYPVSMM